MSKRREIDWTIDINREKGIKRKREDVVEDVIESEEAERGRKVLINRKFGGRKW